MIIRNMTLTALLLILAVMPLVAHGAPPEADYPEAHQDSALDVISEHERTTVAYDVFGEEFAEFVERAPRTAYFVPTDAALEGWDPEDFTQVELAELAERHVASGLVAEQPLEFVDSFITMDGETITVALDPEGRPVPTRTIRYPPIRTTR